MRALIRLWGLSIETDELARLALELGAVEGGYRFLSNNGPDAHQEVAHFHVHIFAGRDLGGMIKRP